jgi:hypothetical protein
MTPEQARAQIANHRKSQSKRIDDLKAVLATWDGGATPARARDLFAEILEIDRKVDAIAAFLRDEES